MIEAKQRRFLRAYFELCLDHGFVINGRGVEDWAQIEEIDLSQCGFLNYFAILAGSDGRVWVGPVEEAQRIKYLLEQDCIETFLWEQHPV